MDLSAARGQEPLMLPPLSGFRPLPYRAVAAALPPLWRAGVLPYPDLRISTLDRMAQASTGLDDYGDDRFARAQLRVLLPALRNEAALNPVGRTIAHGTVLKVLKERLWAHDLFTRFPEILDRPVAAPVVVVGQMRSGTTRAQRLLACDPRFAALRLYETMCPVPWPSSFRNRVDPRIAYTRAGLKFLNWVNPAIGHIHPTGALEVDEELGMLEASFTGAQIEAQRRIPSFARWNEATDQTPAYAHLRRLLQLAGWFRGQDPALPWVLKTPQHLQDLPALLNVFPDARLIFTHRDVRAVVPSGASLAWHQMVVQSDCVDPHWVGREWLHKTAFRAEVAAASRRTMAPSHRLDLDYDEVGGDWRAAMTRVYSFLGLDLPPDVLAAMARTVGAHAANRPVHDYASSDFGLDDAMIDAAVAEPEAVSAA